MKTIQLIKTITNGEEPIIEVLHTEEVADDRWPNATRRYRLQAEKMNRQEETDVYGHREAPEE